MVHAYVVGAGCFGLFFVLFVAVMAGVISLGDQRYCNVGSALAGRISVDSINPRVWFTTRRRRHWKK